MKAGATNLLIIVDRNGTLIEDRPFLGKNSNWNQEIRLKETVVSYLAYLQAKYNTTTIVVSNQAGVALGYFDCATVEMINRQIHILLRSRGVNVDHWQYCPYIDQAYAQSKGGPTVNLSFVREKTKRKPSPEMVYDALKELDYSPSLQQFSEIAMIGNCQDDRALAQGIKSKFVDVNNCSLKELLQQFS